MPVTKDTLDEIALSQAEYRLIVERLGREPNSLELGMFGALWSEHCGYKHSRPLLKLMPSTSRRTLTAQGAENAGAVDIGEGRAIVMKIESHNHPSAIEPYQGAATGVGGIVRDIFTMGARPIALLNSLRFGPLTEPRNRYLLKGVVGGISGYGNCIGVPDVAGEVAFAESYSGNPLVNAMCVGLLEGQRPVSARAAGPGNVVLLVGADTGRDGIHGASGLASRTFEEDRELRSAVQVGNPFLEKVLIEACLEVAKTDHIVGMCDLGAAGLTSAAIESAYRAGTGLELHIDRVPRREEGMNPYEVMLSESQERMLIFVKKGQEQPVRDIFAKWDLHCVDIGTITGDGRVHIYDNGALAADLPIKVLVDAPQYRLTGVKPSWLPELQSYNLKPFARGPLALRQAQGERHVSWREALVRLLASPNIASKRAVFRTYDHQVQDNTVIAPGSADAALLRVKGTRRAIALSVDGNGRLCHLDPFMGGALAVAEACRNVVCVGAQPIALTDGLNFGNPEKPEVYWQLEECIKGMAEACRALEVPVISGNVSLYNETKGQAIYPTPIIGCLGLTANIARRCDAAFKRPGDAVYLIGPLDGSLAGSEYLELFHGLVAGRPVIDLAVEKRVQRCVLQAIHAGIVRSAHDCSEGGIAMALAESAILSGLGVQAEWEDRGEPACALFGEGPSRIIVSVAPHDEQTMQSLAARHKVEAHRLGTVGGPRIRITPHLDLPIADATKAYESGLEQALQG